jgi:fatty-acyl-CoA synthase
VIRIFTKLASRIGLEGWSLLPLARAGVLRPVLGLQIAGMLLALNDYGLLGAATRFTALRDRNNGCAATSWRAPASHSPSKT